MQGEYQILLDLFNRSRETPGFNRLAASVIGRDTSPARGEGRNSFVSFA